MTLTELLSGLLGPAGVAVLCLFLLYAKYQGWWYTRGEYQRLEAEKDDVEQERDHMFREALTSKGASLEILDLIKSRFGQGSGTSPTNRGEW